MKYRNQVMIGLVLFCALFLGPAYLSPFTFTLESASSCIGCITPATYYTPILSWVIAAALIIGITGGAYALILSAKHLIHSLAEIWRNLPQFSD